MGNKVNPIALRVGVYRDWDARWFARDSYAKSLREDLVIRKYVEQKLAGAEIGRVEIEKTSDSVRVILHSARPGIVIGKKGQDIDTLRKDLAKALSRTVVDVSVQEVKSPDLSAILTSRSIADQIEHRASYKGAMKRIAAAAMKAGARGVKIRVAGRVGGAEIAREEWVRVGSVPLHTIRSDVDYGFAEARTTFGTIGVKVWICRGDFKRV